MDKADIVQVMEEIAVLLELKGENPSRSALKQTGARVGDNVGRSRVDY